MNVMMTGRRRCALALLLAALVLSGCGKKDAPDAPEQTAQTAAYSNLSDEASKELLSELFADAGIAAERADKFFACLDQFNGSVKAEWLTDGFETAARPEEARPLYEHFVSCLKKLGHRVETGIFQAEMQVTLINDGPCTFILEK